MINNINSRLRICVVLSQKIIATVAVAPLHSLRPFFSVLFFGCHERTNVHTYQPGVRLILIREQTSVTRLIRLTVLTVGSTHKPTTYNKYFRRYYYFFLRLVLTAILKVPELLAVRSFFFVFLFSRVFVLLLLGRQLRARHAGRWHRDPRIVRRGHLRQHFRERQVRDPHQPRRCRQQYPRQHLR